MQPRVLTIPGCGDSTSPWVVTPNRKGHVLPRIVSPSRKGRASPLKVLKPNRKGRLPSRGPSFSPDYDYPEPVKTLDRAMNKYPADEVMNGALDTHGSVAWGCKNAHCTLTSSLVSMSMDE